MKRLCIAILFLVMSISLCIFEQYTVKSTYEQMTEYIDTAIDYTNNNDYKNAGIACKEMTQYWEKKSPYLTAMIDHSPLDETSITINSLEDLAENESEDLSTTLITAKNQIKTIYDNQKVTFGNVF
ncbi:MAG: DUF4363 family protein [Eubacterium sp.]